MILLFTICVLLGFLFWLLESLPGSRIPGYVSKAFFFAAAVLWAIPAFSGT